MIDEIYESLLSSVNAKLEGTLVAHTQEKAFLVFLPSLLQDELLFIGGHADAHVRRFCFAPLSLDCRGTGGHLKVEVR